MFDGQPVADGDVIVRFTYYGDANLDGVVNSTDETAMKNGEANNLTGWNNGDFDYSGVVDDNDAALLDASESFDLAAPLPPAAENQLYSFTLPGDAVEANTEISTIQNWQVRWGDGFFDNYTVPAGGSPDVLASHTYATPNVGGYAVSIIASGSGGYGSRSHIYTLVLPHEDVVVAPDAPTNLSARESKAGEVDLTWTDDTELAAGYVVTATPTTGGTAITQNTNSSTFAAAFTALTPDVSYTFGVAADNTLSDGISAQSTAATTTAAAPAAALTATGPTNVNEGTTGSALNLSSGSSSNITSWQVIWTDESGNVLSTDTVTGSSGTDAYPSPMPLELNATITAYDSAGHSFILPTFTSVLVPNAPTGLTDTVVSSTEIDLSWVDHSSVAVQDVIYESTDGGATFNPLDEVTPATAGSGNTYAATGLTPNTAYEFYVTAETAYAESTGSDTASASTPFVAPTLDVEGTGTVVEGQPYELDLTADYPDGEAGTVNHWLVDWNDGPVGTSNIISYSYPAGADPTQPLAVTHVFNAGIASPNVTVTAVDTVNGSFVSDPQAVAVIPSAPTGLSATVSGDIIDVSLTTTSHIGTGNTLLISSDDSAFIEDAGATAGSASGSIANLLLDTQYWIEATTDSVNGESSVSSPTSILTSYVAPQLVITPEALPQEGQPYTLSLSATYAANTPQSDMIDDWTVDWGNGQPPVDYGTSQPSSVVSASNTYADDTTAASVTITATDGKGRTFVENESLVFAPPTPLNFGGDSASGGASTTLTWSDTDDIPSQYIIQRKDPGVPNWHTVATVEATAEGASNGYVYTDGEAHLPSPIDGDAGFIYRIAAESNIAGGDTSGTMGLSDFTPATWAGTTPSGPNGPDYSGTWSNPPISDGSVNYFSSGASDTFTVDNLPPHMEVSITVSGYATGYANDYAEFTLDGPEGNQVISNETTFVINMGATDHDATSATYTLTGIVPGDDGTGHARVWTISGTDFSTNWGIVETGDVGLDVGGEQYVPVNFGDYSGLDDLAGTVLNVANYDPSIIGLPDGGSVTLDAEGRGELLVSGIAVGASPLVFEDQIGDLGETDLTPTAPQISTVNAVAVEGATYNSSNTPGFEFNAPYASVSPIVVNYTTDGSTLPTGLMGSLTSDTVTIPVPSDPTASPSLLVPFTPPDDGNVAPERVAVLTPVVPGQLAYPFGLAAKIEVENNDAPTVTINGQQEGATVTVDPQDDPSLIATAAFSFSKDGTVNSSTISWDPGQDLIGLTDGPIIAGVNDLASLPGTHSTTGGDYYTFYGILPSKVYVEAIGGSSSTDSTSLDFGVDLFKAATPIIGLADADPQKASDDTQSGWVIFSSGSPVRGSLQRVIVGEEMDLSVGYFGPGDDGSLPYNAQVKWSIEGKIAAGFTGNVTTTPEGVSHSVSKVLPADLNPIDPDNQGVSFYWYGGAFDGQKEYVSCNVQSPVLSGTAVTFFDVYRPSDQVSVDKADPIVATPDGTLRVGQKPDLIFTPSGVVLSVAADSKDPLGFSPGSYEWIQTIARVDEYDSPTGRTVATWSGLDARNPAFTGPLFFDSPLISVGYSDPFDRAGMAGRYETYLMYKPNFANSAWVPLRLVTWSAIGFEVRGHPGGDWKLQSARPVKPLDIDNDDYPQWNTVALEPSEGESDGFNVFVWVPNR